MPCMFFSFVLVYLYVSQCTLTWKNGYAEHHEFKEKIKIKSINQINKNLKLRIQYGINNNILSDVRMRCKLHS